MFIKALLPLIAAIKYKLDHVCGEQFGEQIAQVYKACKEELNRPEKSARAAAKAAESESCGNQPNA